MNVFNRMIVILLCLIASAFSIIVFLIIGGIIRPTQVSPGGFLAGLWSFYSQLSPTNATIAALGFALILLVALGLVILEGVNIRRRADHFVVREDRLGKVTVARSSVRQLVGYEARKIRGVIETRHSVEKGRNGLRVQVRALLFPEVNAPEVGHTLQEKVQEAMKRHMGIEVTEVQVTTQLDPFEKPRKRRLQ